MTDRPRLPVIRRSRTLPIDLQYLLWLVSRSNGDIQTIAEARAYVKGGRDALDKLRHGTGYRPHADTAATAREAELTPSDRRWARIQHNCNVKWCLLPANHSGPHQAKQFDIDEALAKTDDSDMSKRHGP